MFDISNLAELSIYRLKDGVFQDEAGTVLHDYPDLLRDLHDYWRSRCNGHPFPARADIDPVDIPTLLEHLVLIDVLSDPLDFRYRLVGGHIVHHSKRNVQGQTVRSLMADGGPRGRALQAKALLVGESLAKSQAPVYLDVSYGVPGSDSHKRLQGLMLPLGEPGKGINMVLGGLNYLK